MRSRDRFDERNLTLADLLQNWDVLGVYQSEDRPRDDEEYDDLVESPSGSGWKAAWPPKS